VPGPDPSRPWDHDMPSVCPQCGAHHEAMANTVNNDAPSNGDVNLCVVCKGISIFDDSVPTKLRYPTDDELTEINKDPRIQDLRSKMKVVDILLGPPKGDYFPDR